MVAQPGDDAEHGHAPAFLQDAHAVGEEAGVAAEFVDNQPAHQRSLRRLQQPKGAEQLGEDAALVNVANEQYGRLDVPGHGHVDDVASFEIELGRAARALDDHQIGARPQPCQRRGDHLPQLGFAAIIFAGGQGVPLFAQHHDLGPAVGLRFEQHRVHVHVGRDATRLGLCHLGAADLAAFGRDAGVVAHVLRLERRNSQPTTGVEPAQAGYQQAFAHGGGRALDHQRFGGHSILVTCAPIPALPVRKTHTAPLTWQERGRE